MTNLRRIEVWAAAAAASWSFNLVWSLPVFGPKIQPPELLALALFVVAVPERKSIWKTALQVSSIEKWLWTVLMIVLLHAVWLRSRAVWLEMAGLVYLLILFWVFKWLSERIGPAEFLQKMARWLVFGAGLAVATGLALWAAVYLGWAEPTGYAAVRAYPYLGKIPGRLAGFASSPTMFVFMVGLGGLSAQFLHEKDQWPLSKWRIAGVAAAVVALVLTFSKNVAMLAGTALWQWGAARSGSYWSRAAQVGAAVLLVAQFVAAHVFWFGKSHLADESSWARSLADFDRPIIETTSGSAYWTTYSMLKKTAVEAGLERFPMGVGPGQHAEWLCEHQAAGKYPANMRLHDPHCLFTGTFGELGAIGLAAVLGLVWAIAKGFQRAAFRRLGLSERAYLSSVFLLFLAESLTSDVLNHRAIWAFLAIFCQILARPRESLPIDSLRKRTQTP